MLYQWSDGSIHRVPHPTQEELALYSLLFAHRTLFAKGKIEFQVHDPLPPQDVPSFIEFTQKMSVEEVKKRFPDTTIHCCERDNDGDGNCDIHSAPEC